MHMVQIPEATALFAAESLRGSAIAYRNLAENFRQGSTVHTPKNMELAAGYDNIAAEIERQESIIREAANGTIAMGGAR